MDNKNLPAYPLPCAINENGVYTTLSSQEGDAAMGLTKREELASRIFTALISNPKIMELDKWTPDYVLLNVDMAITAADTLLLHLEKTQK